VILSTDPTWRPAEGLELGRLSDLAIGPEGQLLLLDGMAGQILVFSSAAPGPTTFGRSGEGPGEFSTRAPLRGMIVTDSSVLVPDLDLQRITEFSVSGEVLAITPYPFAVYAVDWRSHPAGGLVFRSLDESGDVLIRLREGRVDTLYSFPVDGVEPVPNLLLPPTSLWDVTARGELITGRSDRSRVELRAAESEHPVWIARFSLPEIVTGERDEAHLRELVAESVRRRSPGAAAELIQRSVASVHMPNRAPVLAGILAAPDGHVWVRRAKPVLSMGLEALRVGSAEAFGGERWDILNADGLLETRVRLPERFTPRRFSGPWLYGILEDELGVQTPARVSLETLMAEGAHR
jgi:hypothetical protein